MYLFWERVFKKIYKKTRLGEFFVSYFYFSERVSLSSLVASFISRPDSPMFLPNFGSNLPPKSTSNTTARMSSSGQPKFLNMFLIITNNFYLLAFLYSLIASDTPLMNSGILFDPNKSNTTTATVRISTVPMFILHRHPLPLL